MGKIDRKAIARDYADGVRISDIAARHGVPYSSVGSIAGRLGVLKRRVTTLDHLDPDQIAALWFSNRRVSDILFELSCAKPRLGRIQAHFGFPYRHGFDRKMPDDLERMRAEWAAKFALDRASEGKAGDVPTHAFPAAPVTSGSPFWTPARDAAVRDTGGRWQAVSALADKWDRPSAHVIARWHRLGAAA